MTIFYRKKLECGCIIIAVTTKKENNMYFLGGHNYNYICDTCKNIPEHLLDKKLEIIYNNDNIVSNNTNGWLRIGQHK